MTEYWVSKKQYWCKYCSLFIRDDAPSRKQHETGLKHQGQKERFIRDLYKQGNQAKREKESEALEIARIERSANAAYAKDTHLPISRPSLLSTLKPSSSSASRIRDKPVDKWKNYSTAAQLGFEDDTTPESSYRIEQELKGRAGEVGAWETVQIGEEPGYAFTPEGLGSGSGEKRKLGEYEVDDKEDEGFRFEHRGKRAVRDVWEEDWDPKKALGKAKIKVKEGRMFEERKREEEVKDEPVGGLDREGWSGKLELNAVIDLGKGKGTEKEVRDGLVYVEGGGWVKAELEEPDNQVSAEEQIARVLAVEQDIKPDTNGMGRDPTNESSDPNAADGSKSATIDLVPEEKSAIVEEAETVAVAGAGLFKKRRPPPGAGRKK